VASIELSPDEYAEAVDIARRVARPVLGPRADAELEDVAQEAIARLLEEDPAPNDWRAWLNRVARNTAVDVGRHAARFDEKDGPEADQDQLLRDFVLRVLSTSEAGMIEAGMAFVTSDLTGRDREMLLASVNGASNAELAEDFGLASPEVVAQTLYRIRRRLRGRLEGAGYERHHPRPY